MKPIERRLPNGFTLIEMLLVMAIITIIGGMAMPAVGNTLAYFRVNSDGRSLSNSISLAKMQAASRFARTRVYVDFTLKGFRTEVKTSTTAWTALGEMTFL